MSRDSWWPVYSWGLIAASFGIFLVRCNQHGGFFAEDAYITFRYAAHLAEGHGIVWNIGEAPSEGYTSPLHVALLALSLRIGLPLAQTAYGIGLLSIAGLVLLYGLALRRRVGAVTPIAALILSVFLIDSRLAIHATAGLDTALHLFFLGLTTVLGWRLLETPSRRSAIALAIINFFCLLTRPDAAPFIVGQSVVVLGLAIWQHRRSTRTGLLRYGALSYTLLFVLGSAYLAWKLWYFGYLLPNPFYLKSNEFRSLHGLDSVVAFLKSLRYLGLVVLIGLLFVDYRKLADWWSQAVSKAKVGLIVLPSVLFLVYYSTVIPEVNYASRFAYPTYFPLSLALALALSSGCPVRNLLTRLSRWFPPRLLGLAAAGLSILFVAYLYRSTRLYFPWFEKVEVEYYRPIGEALKSTGLGPSGSLVFSSAGVVPFTSGFTHIDPVGLTDNALCGRHELSAMERESYIWSRNADLYIGPEPPASPGADDLPGEPAIAGEYVEQVLLADFGRNLAYRRFYGDLGNEESAELIHSRMRELRDRWILLGEIPYPVPINRGYTTFAYVRRNSPRFNTLASVLSPLIATPPEELHQALSIAE